MILLSVSITLLLLRNNHIFLYQSLNFVQSLSNYSGSGTMLFVIAAYMFLLNATGASATDISVSVLLYSFEASSVICKDPSHSNNASMSSVPLKLVLVSLYSLCYMCFSQ